VGKSRESGTADLAAAASTHKTSVTTSKRT